MVQVFFFLFNIVKTKEPGALQNFASHCIEAIKWNWSEAGEGSCTKYLSQAAMHKHQGPPEMEVPVCNKSSKSGLYPHMLEESEVVSSSDSAGFLSQEPDAPNSGEVCHPFSH